MSAKVGSMQRVGTEDSLLTVGQAASPSELCSFLGGGWFLQIVSLVQARRRRPGHHQQGGARKAGCRE